MEKEQVLVTGVGSYIGLHIVRLLLDSGYPVRGTVRDLRREGHLRAVLARHTSAGNRLELVAADLTKDAGWDAAVRGCPYVMHVASPFRIVPKSEEQSLVGPAVEGTLRVLRAAEAGGARRVVLTSSIAAMIAGHQGNGKTISEQDWSILTPQTDAYMTSKTLAERAAWDFVHALPPERGFEMAAVNPSFVAGPFMDETFSGTSSVMFKELINRTYPGNPAFDIGMVDVRDVAQAHLSAMVTPEAAGKRFCCQAGNLWVYEIAEILNRHFAARGYPVRTNRMPSFLVRLVGLFDPNIRALLYSLDSRTHVDTSQIRAILGWSPRPLEQTLVDTVESMIQLKMV
jgi:dihydroflavonol-4-reductase